MYDLNLTNGTIVDGSGKPPYRADVAVERGRIVKIGLGDSLGEAAATYDISGKMVMPGFIDMHSHSDLVYLGASPPDVKIHQGVTTELIGQDGLGVAPVAHHNRGLLADLTDGLLGYMPRDVWKWGSFEDYLQVLDRTSLPCNLAVLISHGPVRIEAMGMENRSPDFAEQEKMENLVREAMEAGAFGFSTGLVYPPCSFADESEIEGLLRAISPYDGIYVVHQRDECRNLLHSFEEVAREAENAGVHLHVSHLLAFGRSSWPQMDLLLERADELISRGRRITWDRYPYLAGCTMLSASLPDWVFSEGPRALIANLVNPEYREKIRRYFGYGLDVWNNRGFSIGWNNVVVSGVRSEKNKWMEGKDCQELADCLGKDIVDFMCDLLHEEELAVTMITRYGSQDVLAKVLTHPSGTIGTDGVHCGTPHPRLHGSFPRFFQDFVVQKQKLSWAEAVKKVTYNPASILGLTDRGLISEGLAADLVVLDPKNIADRATFEDPAQHPSGIDMVIVNGQVVVDSNGTTGCLPGKVLRKRRFGE